MADPPPSTLRWSYGWEAAVDLGGDTAGWAEVDDNGFECAMAFLAGPGRFARRPTDDSLRRVRVIEERNEGELRYELPFTADDRASVDADVDWYLGEWNIPPRPSGYDWFVAVPPGEDGEAFVIRIENRFIRIAQMEEWPQELVVAELYRDAYPG
ncbi:MAG TPA: DUF5956 family protein [Amnibacterium sp.]|jgi:hypothetical protein|uniref:DUF5956 family protein n=1 Tax=Amnibacterium sp. TaxID=1872496 RepID=UPI002F93A79E